MPMPSSTWLMLLNDGLKRFPGASSAARSRTRRGDPEKEAIVTEEDGPLTDRGRGERGLLQPLGLEAAVGLQRRRAPGGAAVNLDRLRDAALPLEGLRPQEVPGQVHRGLELAPALRRRPRDGAPEGRLGALPIVATHGLDPFELGPRAPRLGLAS